MKMCSIIPVYNCVEVTKTHTRQNFFEQTLTSPKLKVWIFILAYDRLHQEVELSVCQEKNAEPSQTLTVTQADCARCCFSKH